MPPIPITPRSRRKQNTAFFLTKEGVVFPVVNHGDSGAVLSDCACTDVVNDSGTCAVKND